jgi:hypothetical protein
MKIIKKQRWVRVFYFCVPLRYDEEGYLQTKHSAEKTFIARYDFPYWVFDKRRRFFDLKHAQLQLKHTNQKVDVSFAFYIKSDRTESQSRTLRISSAKAQITKIQNRMEQYARERRKELFWEPENDEQWQKALRKLEQKKQKLREIINQKREVELNENNL